MSTKPIQKVALAGATGNLGPSILSQLLSHNFDVTVLTRATSTNTFPPNVKVATVDYDSLSSLTEALKGNDALVSTLASLSITTQLILIDAAIATGTVKRIIPSDYGCDTTNHKSRQLPFLADKLKVQAYLEEKTSAKDSQISYTFVNTGPFFDWCLMVGLLLNTQTHTAELYDGGDKLFSTTTLDSIGQAVAAVLEHPEETKNRPVKVQNAAVSQNQLLEIAEKLSGGKKWETTVVEVAPLLQAAYAELEKSEPNMMVFAYNMIKTVIWGNGYGGEMDPKELDNELLGVKDFGPREIEAVVKRFVK